MRATLRIVTFVVCFLLGALVVWVSAEIALWKSGATRSAMALDVMPGIRKWKREVRQDHGPLRIAFLGDSVLMGEPGWPSVPSATQRALRFQDGPVRGANVHDLAWPAWGPAGQYCLVDELIEAHPDVVVLEMNLRTLGPRPLGSLGYPEFSGFVRTRRLLEAALLPLSFAGITLNRMLFYRLLVANGAEGLWQALLDRQARLFNVRAVLEPYLDEKRKSRAYQERRAFILMDGIRKSYVNGKPRATLSAAKDVLGSALAGLDASYDRVRVFDAVLREFRRAGLPVLVWVAPVNVDHLRSIGISTERLKTTVATLRRVTERRGAEFVDFHAVFHDDVFRDGGDHLNFAEEPNGTVRLGERLAAAIAAMRPVQRRRWREADALQ